jgi:uncharacterized protein
VSVPAVQELAIFGAGVAAGTINAVVGSGTLITFPTLIGFGYPPVLANVSNNVGLVPGVLSGVYGYREELTGQRARMLRLGSASLLGGIVGAVLLLVLPQSAFKAIVPVLIAISLVMVIAQPWLSRKVAARSGTPGPRRPAAAAPPGPQHRGEHRGGNAPGQATAGDGPPDTAPPDIVPADTVRADTVRADTLPADTVPVTAARASTVPATAVPAKSVPANAVPVNAALTTAAPSTAGNAAASAPGGPVVWALVFLTGIYGGYFGAAQGILLIGLMGIAFSDNLQRINAVKNVLALIVNAVAALVFIAATHVDWTVAALIAAGSTIGGQVGARAGRRLPPWGLRAVIVCVGTAALVRLLS